MIATLLLALAPQAPSGFSAGDLVVHDPAKTTAFGSGGFRIVDPLDGTVSDLDYDVTQTTTAADVVAYNAVRDRLIFVARTSTTALGVRAGTAGGTYETLAQYVPPQIPHGLAINSNGKIYFSVANLGAQRFRYVDLAGNVNVVGDGAGGQFVAQGVSIASHVEYDPGTNSLVAVSRDFGSSGCSPGGGKLLVQRFDLNEAGTDILGVECTAFDMVPNATNADVRGLSVLGPGKLLFFLKTGNTSGQNWQGLRLVEPEGGPGGTITVSDWANLSSSLGGSSAYSGMTFSVPRDEAVLLGHFFDTVAAVAEGDTGIQVFSPLGVEISNSNVGGIVDIRSLGKKGLFPIGASSVSLAAGGAQGLDVDYGAGAAFDFYAVVGSASGFAPTTLGGLTLPLALDGYTTFSLTKANTSVLKKTIGLLDASGRATATVAVPAGAPISLAGVTLHHSAVRLSSATGALIEASNAVALRLEP